MGAVKKCWSVLTDDMGNCYVTGLNVVHIHHVFNGSRKAESEKYGFLVPLHPTLHVWGPDSVHMSPNRGLDLRLKQECQKYFEKHYGSRSDFIEIFGKSYLEN